VALFLVGGAFLVLGALGWVARTAQHACRRPGRLSVAVDLLIGLAAVSEAATGLTERPFLVLAWSAGAAVATVVAVVLGRQTRRHAVGAPSPDSAVLAR
jgi:hypothetical protein